MDWQSEDLDLGQRCEQRAVRFKGSLFQTRGGIGGLATNEKATKARGCVRGRERDGPKVGPEHSTG
jgi:hypothetical protein